VSSSARTSSPPRNGCRARSGGFTEFVPLPFVHMQAPIYLKGRARQGATFRTAVLMHAVARLGAFLPFQAVTERPDTGQDARKAVAPGIDPIELDRQRVAALAVLDIDRADDGVIFRRSGVLHLQHVRAAEVVDL
jgi:hypothetical protein